MGQVFPPILVVLFDPKSTTELNGKIASIYQFDA
jgi:hypothetical protein